MLGHHVFYHQIASFLIELIDSSHEAVFTIVRYESLTTQP